MSQERGGLAQARFWALSITWEHHYTLSSNGIFLRWSRTLWSHLSSLWIVYCFESLLLSSLHLDWTSIGPVKPSKKDIFGSPFPSLPGKASLLRFSAENLLWLWFNQWNASQDSCDRLIILRLSFRSVAPNVQVRILLPASPAPILAYLSSVIGDGRN